MIVAERKPIQEILKMIQGYNKIIIIGCKTCVTVCAAGGEKEVGIISSLLKLARRKEKKEIEIVEICLERQCEKEFVKELEQKIENTDAIISVGCGVGVQMIAEQFPQKLVYPGLNTKFIGATIEQGEWTEKCLSCGDCILAQTGGICPISRCSKNLLNGPCGGSQNGKCEIDKELDCAWQLIYDRMKLLGRLEELEQIQPIKDWSKSRDGGPRKVIRNDLKIERLKD